MLFPSVTVLTTCLIRAALDVLGDECSRLPVGASLLALILEDVRLSSEILPIMSVNTLCLVMFFVEWAPLRLEIEHIEIGVLFHLMDQSRFEIFGAVSK